MTDPHEIAERYEPNHAIRELKTRLAAQQPVIDAAKELVSDEGRLTEARRRYWLDQLTLALRALDQND